jgi:hypothetical protein
MVTNRAGNLSPGKSFLSFFFTESERMTYLNHSIMRTEKEQFCVHHLLFHSKPGYFEERYIFLVKIIIEYQ